MKPVVTEKFEFENGDDTKMLAHLESSEIKNISQESKRFVISKNHSLNVSSFRFRPFGRN